MKFYDDMFVPFLYLVAGIVIFKFLARKIYPYFMNNLLKCIHSHLQNIKEQLFDEAFKHINTESESLEILEIGIGTGENFDNYPKNANLTILDKSDEFLPFLQESINKNKRDDLKISKLIINNAENMCSIASNSTDAIVHTFVLCSIKDPDVVLREIDRILKPGGVCIFIEHSINKNVCDYSLLFSDIYLRI
jgi:ubiquinone/menaquinone biosynthesis C-methylase UbiE